MSAPAAIPGVFGPPFTPARLPFAPSRPGGGISGASLAGVEGFCVAFDDDWNEPDPVWTRLDDPGGRVYVQSWSIDRGRDTELDRTATGTATVQVRDLDGLLDPTNTASPYYGKLDPNKQAAIALQNPVTGDWTTLFRGYIDSIQPTVDVSELFEDYTVDLVDGFAILAAAELIPGEDGDTDVPAESEGDLYYDSVQVYQRMNHVLNDVGWAWTMRKIATGNVLLQATVYAPRTAALSVLQDAADGEFPGVANAFIAKDGDFRFDGRLIRFHPDDYPTFVNQWQIGDLGAFGG